MVVFLLTCGMMRAAAIAASAERPSWWEALPDEEWPSVDMLVRSHSGETAQLLLLLRSVEMYWPIEKWGVIVVLDEDPFDAALALTLPAFVRAFLEPPPSHWDAFAGVRRRMEGVEVPGSTRANFSDWDVAAESRGYVRAQWSHLNSDAYSDADFIAWVDTDCIFFTFVTPALLFSRDDAGSSAFVRRPSRPVVACGDAPIVYWPVIRVLGWPWVCEFMVGFPFVLHRGVFPTARAAIRAAFERRGAWGCEKSGYYRGAVDPECQMAPLAAPPDDEAFGEAFAWLGRATREGFARQLRDGALLPCAITILGHVAYLYDYDGHRFSVHHVPQDRSWPFDAIRQIFPAVTAPSRQVCQRALCQMRFAAPFIAPIALRWNGCSAWRTMGT
eukprot:TRINITY_DN26833_c0_g1_i2.p1 TRINITY_DN26833_c0_g1~~TRINITY_DN26833_c0_g1_i2.p1  ORF type:complete len:411 (-),score=81.03 TRINITY_DN26833_c0_g1_i2:268-1428(-)